MDSVFTIGSLIAVFVGVPILIGVLLYLLPKRMGHPKVGKYLLSGFVFLIPLFVLFVVFEDEFFTKK